MQLCFTPNIAISYKSDVNFTSTRNSHSALSTTDVWSGMEILWCTELKTTERLSTCNISSALYRHMTMTPELLQRVRDSAIESSIEQCIV